MEDRKNPSMLRRVFLIVVGVMALFLDKLEGKSIDPQPAKTGRIEIVD